MVYPWQELKNYYVTRSLKRGCEHYFNNFDEFARDDLLACTGPSKVAQWEQRHTSTLGRRSARAALRQRRKRAGEDGTMCVISISRGVRDRLARAAKIKGESIEEFIVSKLNLDETSYR